MARECYICGSAIVKANSALEHIIPNFLGGKISSRAFICKTHNNALSPVDETLLPLTIFANQLSIERDRGHNPDIEFLMREPGQQPISLMRSENGNFFAESVTRLEGNSRFDYEIRLLTSDPEKKSETMSRIKKQVLEDTEKLGLDKEQQKTQWKIFKTKIQEAVRYIRPELETLIEFGDDMFWGMLKVIISYYAYLKLDIELIKDKVNLLKAVAHGGELSQLDCVSLYFPDEFYNNKTIHHTISIIGSKDNNVIYGLISLFGVANCLILLSTSYNGKDFTYGYSYDFRRTSEVNFSKRLDLRLPDIMAILSTKHDNTKLEAHIHNFFNFFLVGELSSDIITEIIQKIMLELNINILNYESNIEIFRNAFKDMILNDDRCRLLNLKEIDICFDKICHILKYYKAITILRPPLGAS